jgi:hypothetical protein
MVQESLDRIKSNLKGRKSRLSVNGWLKGLSGRLRGSKDLHSKQRKLGRTSLKTDVEGHLIGFDKPFVINIKNQSLGEEPGPYLNDNFGYQNHTQHG